jgi:putative aminopeptidase FrvX
LAQALDSLVVLMRTQFSLFNLANHTLVKMTDEINNPIYASIQMSIKNLLTIVALLCLTSARCVAQSGSKTDATASMLEEMRDFVQTPAVSGYENELAAKITSHLKGYSPKTDNFGNVTITLGSGTPKRMLAAPMDEMGFLVGDITEQGYLRCQRFPQLSLLPLFQELHAAQPVKVKTSAGKWISGVVAGLSVHLAPFRPQPPDLSEVENMFVDVGAGSAEQARTAGIGLGNPVAIDRKLYEMAGERWASAAIGDRFGDVALLQLLSRLDLAKLQGTFTIAFVAQQWPGIRGLQRVIDDYQPSELIFVGRLMRVPVVRPGTEIVFKEFTKEPGDGLVIGSGDPSAALTGLPAEFKQLADQANVKLTPQYSNPMNFLNQFGLHLPERFVHLSIPTMWPSTPAEFLDAHDLSALIGLLQKYLQGNSVPVEVSPASKMAASALSQRPLKAPAMSELVRQLVGVYGVSGHEKPVQEAIAHLLPPWAKPETDSSGNLILHWKGTRGPKILMIAHTDEIGYEVRSILPDGRLQVEPRGGSVPGYTLGHPAFVHSANGIHPGVMELPSDWLKHDFHWSGPQVGLRMDAGARSAEEATALGIKAGDFITVPKEYRNLLGSRATARSVDDRIGCAALIESAWTLGPDLHGRDLTFVWSAGEEAGFTGAKALAAQGAHPDYVFAVDSFVTSDSPLESSRFSLAPLGKGFAVRAVDYTSVVPEKIRNRVVAMADSAHIPVQVGVTNGGTDAAEFAMRGAIPISIGWPMRYSHSPVEVFDTIDMDALAKMVTLLARAWE